MKASLVISLLSGVQSVSRNPQINSAEGTSRLSDVDCAISGPISTAESFNGRKVVINFEFAGN